MDTQTTTQRIATLQADSKRVYKSGGNILIALADTYGATSKALAYYRAHPERLSPSLSLAVAVTGTKSSLVELQRATYAAIKTQLRELGA